MKYKDQQELVAGLRELADFVEAHIELPIDRPNFKLSTILWDRSRNTFPYDVIEGSAKRSLRRAVLALGSAKKDWSDNYLDVSRNFGPIKLEFTINKNKVCERIVTGTEVVPEYVVPEHVKETVEWKCVESILA